MTEDDLIRRWFPDAHQESRARRLVFDRGQFPNCRHYKRIKDRKFHCGKRKSEKMSCYGCSTCPNCDGRLAFDSREVTYAQHGIYINEAYICVHCGTYITHERFRPKKKPAQEVRKAGRCEVAGCKHTAYEGHAYSDIVVDTMRTWIICEQHHRRVKTWRYNKNKGLDQKPIIVEDGKLADNPEYRKKQEKKS